MSVRMAVDIGGTFTDLVAVDEQSGAVFVDKSPSSAADPVSAVRDVIARTGLDLGDVTAFVHGTTVATNALVQRRGCRVVFVTNAGFRDVLFTQTGTRRDLYSLTWEKPRPLVARHDCREVGGRIDRDGGVLAPLGDDDVTRLIAYLRAEAVRSVAIGFLFSYLNPEHELELARRLAVALPDVAVSLSHQVYPRWRENDRWQTTVADAFLKPGFGDYVGNLSAGLQAAGMPARVLVMKSNGGVVPAREAARTPINYLLSGPVGGVLGGAHFAAEAGRQDIMTLDIGGTTSDVCLVAGGDVRRVASYELAHGIPVKATTVDIRTIGAGGGSIAWVDPGGLLRVGPDSAGSDPGPVCYGKGGVSPTPTDANVVLGRIDPARFADGRLPLDAEAAHNAVSRLASEVGLDVAGCALAILDLANHAMVDALRIISVERGVDPRALTLVAFGGAGGLHAAEVARIMELRAGLVPPHPGNLSAYGLLTAGVRFDASRTVLVRSDAADAHAVLTRTLQSLQEDAVATLRREGFQREPRLERYLEMRYLGQNYHREIPIDTELPMTEAALEQAFEGFHRDYSDYYGYAQPDELVEIVGAGVTAFDPDSVTPGKWSLAGEAAPAPKRRTVHFAGTGPVDTTIHGRASLAAGFAAAGPLIVEEPLSTTVVPPGATLRVLESGTLEIERTTG
jgi:N-methylhydantoinase A